MKKIAEGVALWRKYSLYEVTGTIHGEAAPSRTIHLKDDDDGREIAINLGDLAIPCHEGHKVTARSIDKAVWFDVHNNTTGDTGDGYESVRTLRHYVAATGLIKYGAFAFAGLTILILTIFSAPGKMDVPSDIFFGFLGFVGGYAVLIVPAMIITIMRASSIEAALARAHSK